MLTFYLQAIVAYTILTAFRNEKFVKIIFDSEGKMLFFTGGFFCALEVACLTTLYASLELVKVFI